MAVKCLKGHDGVLNTLVAQYNLLRKQTATNGSKYHADQVAVTSGDGINPVATASLITTANASAGTLATMLTLANDMKAFLNTHMADATVHAVADATNTIATADATDQTTANTLANAIKTALNGHNGQSGVHFTDDTNDNATTGATTAGTCATLLNALKSDINTHVASKPQGFSIALVGP